MDLAGDDLLEDLGRLGLVLVGHQAQRDFLFLGDELGRHVFGADMRRVHGGDMHRDALGQFLGTALERHQHADAAAMDIAADHAIALDAGHAAHVDLLADGGDQGLGGILDATAARVGGSLQSVDIGGAGVQCDVGDGVAELQEARVLADEVGFAIDLDQHGLAAGLGGHDAAFGSDAAGLLVSLGQAGLAQPLHRGVEVAVVLDQRFLAFHHAGAGTLTQFLHHLGGNIAHR